VADTGIAEPDPSEEISRIPSSTEPPKPRPLRDMLLNSAKQQQKAASSSAAEKEPSPTAHCKSSGSGARTDIPHALDTEEIYQHDHSEAEPPYHVLLHNETLGRLIGYQEAIAAGTAKVGRKLKAALKQANSTSSVMSSVTDFLASLLRTKQPQIFAESAVRGDGSDWTALELSLLGDVAIAVPVLAYDNGLHFSPQHHPEPIPCTLLFVPGALLASAGRSTPDWTEVVHNGAIDEQAFYAMYGRRLLPSLHYASRQAQGRGCRAFVTIPGLGCGCFAGRFKGQLGRLFGRVLRRLLREHGSALPGLAAVYYDPFDEGSNKRLTIEGVSYIERPLRHGNEDCPQLCLPAHYEEEGDDFSDCLLFSVVAWDHVSWPGNDFWAGERCTDDGVKAAATDTMWRITGVEGSYDTNLSAYIPPAPYKVWDEVVVETNTVLSACNFSVFPSPVVSSD